ncbi:MAG: threonine ammonia-lyase, biosynthetic [Deltaproteobacteria bacterium]|nr:threonine ammonia-lyase, biosynthetic [Deltaproteobacteria bacterium]
MPTSQFLEKVLTARVYDVAIETPLDEMSVLSKRCGNRILIKREDLQPVFSFKLRGAFNKVFMAKQSDPNLTGVIAASAGNHAQGVALAAKKLHLQAIIVMPVTTPTIKINSVKSYGARVILHGENYDAAYQHSLILAKQKALSFIHAYDDIDVIAGQATIAHEIIRQCPDGAHAIFVPVGGGGLLAGIAGFIKRVKPSIKVIGVEPEDAACLAAAMKTGRRVRLKEVGIFADGVAVRQIGRTPFKMIKHIIDDTITVTTDQICAAIKDTFDNTRAICEPAGAVSLAGLKKYIDVHKPKGETLIAINSGANMNFDRLRHVSERADFGEQREALIAATIPEQPGSFLGFCRTIGKRQITEFNYRYADANRAIVFAGIQLVHGTQEKEEMISHLTQQGYSVDDMTDNEVAKLHTRYMVGGHPQAGVNNERIFRFQFPEKPGALLKFLDRIGHRWNISLFHYRNHGADYGRVLLGIQVGAQDQREFRLFLQSLNFPFWEETQNPAYQLFLR